MLEVSRGEPVTAHRDGCYSRTEEQVRMLHEEIPSGSLHLSVLEPDTQIFPSNMQKWDPD